MRRFLCILFLAVSISGFGQSPLHRKADKFYTRLQFVAAANLYEKIVKKNPADQLAKARLTQCYKYLKSNGDWRSQPTNRQASSGANVPVR